MTLKFEECSLYLMLELLLRGYPKTMSDLTRLTQVPAGQVEPVLERIKLDHTVIEWQQNGYHVYQIQ